MKYLKIFEDFSPIDVPELETPPKWVKNPRVWAMDKIVALLTPESNIHLMASTYVDSGIFNFKDLKTLESSIRAIYQSSKDKKELDVKDHVRRYQLGLWQKMDYNKLKQYISKNKDKTDLIYKFENLLKYFHE